MAMAFLAMRFPRLFVLAQDSAVGFGDGCLSAAGTGGWAPRHALCHDKRRDGRFLLLLGHRPLALLNH